MSTNHENQIIAPPVSIIINKNQTSLSTHTVVAESAKNANSSSLNKNKDQATSPLNYKNGRKLEPVMFDFTNYYTHREKLPVHYHPLVQYLESTEVKFHNDNLYENSPIGFPTKSQILKERVVRLPILKDSLADRARYRRKLNDKQQNIVSARKKYDFKTHDDFSSHYFLTGARFNRYDTIDSKILNKYGMFINRHNPQLVYVKSTQNALENISRDLTRAASLNFQNSEVSFKSKSIQVSPSSLSQRDLNNKQEVN